MLSDEQLKEILIQQRETFLKKPFGVERIVLKNVEQKIKLPHVIVITGLRRSGKSTLLRQVIQRHYGDEEFYYITFEDERLFNFPAHDFSRIHEVLIGLFGKKKAFFVDEIQNVQHFETFVRRLYEEGYKFFITGSSATLLSRELGTKLAGRHVDIVVRPFSFSEFLTLRGVKGSTHSLYKTEEKVMIKKYFDEYLIKGGVPEYVLYHDLEILTKIYEDTVIKDIAVRHKIENVVLLRELYQYLITNFANRFSFNALKNLMRAGSVNTIKKHVSYLEDTYFAKTISKFDYSLKKQLVNDKKLYVIDNGFIGVVSQKMSKDKGWLLENLVFNRLNENNGVFYYAEKGECDFVIAKNKRVTQAIQVCFDFHAENKERELSGIAEALCTFNLKEGLILTYSQEEEIRRDNKKVIIKPVWKWLLSQE